MPFSRFIRSLPPVLSCVLLAGLSCSPEKESPYTFTRFAMGTFVEYTVFARNAQSAEAAVNAAHREIERVDDLLWEQDSVSEIYAFNRSDSGLSGSQETFEFIRRCREYYETTSGAFDITIGPVLNLYPFGDSIPVPPSPSLVKRKV